MRVKRGFKARRRRNRVLKLAKGFRGRRHGTYKRAVEAVVANGCEIVRPIGADAPELTARFRDPGGNVIGLYQQPA